VDGEPIQATQLFDAMIATAFLTSDMNRILDAGAAATDPASEMHGIVADVRRWYAQNPGDWRATRRLIKEKYALYGGQDMRDRNGVKLNGSSTVAALLYGRGDFVETVRAAFNFGWDADNNAATSGCIVGVIKGWKWMRAQGWDIKDLFRNTSRDEMPMDETITRFGDRLIAIAEQNIRDHGGAKTAAGYRICTENAAPVERLSDPRRQLTELQARLKPEIEAAIAHGASAREQARAAYLAICLDQAAGLKQRYPEGWAKAVEALAGYPKVIDVIFYQSGPAGAALREKAVAAGLRKPEARVKFE
jgi:hypothetical protein